jgi:hypothetical protein
MKTTIKNTLAAALLTGAVALSGLTACSSSDDSIADETPIVNPAQPQTYHVRIHASMGSDGTTRAVSFDGTTSNSFFNADEAVAIYNATTGFDPSTASILATTNISEDGKSCDFEGDINGTPSVGDVLELLYNLDMEGATFYYEDQKCTASTVVDAALARLKVKAVDGEGNITFCQEDGTDDATAYFKNLQSMFRLQFKDADSNPISVRKLTITSANNAIVAVYDVLHWGYFGDDVYLFSPITVKPASATSDYLYVAVSFDESKTANDVLTFTVTDARGDKYEGTKAAPTGGFKNAKYYYNSTPIQLTLTEKFLGPDIEWTSVQYIPEPDGNCISVYGPLVDDHFIPSAISLSGTSEGYYFWMNHGSTVTLNGLTATYDGNYGFIHAAAGDLNLVVNGTNSISCKNSELCVAVDGTLKLSGNGTLTVTALDSSRYGLHAVSNYHNSIYDSVNQVWLDPNNSDPSVLAATGYTVSRSDTQDNGDGTYTWTYTVAPAQ